MLIVVGTVVTVTAIIAAVFALTPAAYGLASPLSNIGFHDAGPADDGPAPLIVHSEPSAAHVILDGRERGLTPLVLHTTSAKHAIAIEKDGFIGAAATVDTGLWGATVDLALWSGQPAITHLRPPYPGSQLTDAAFLADGRVRMDIAVPDPSGRNSMLHEDWIVQPASQPDADAHAAPAGSRAAAVAISPDGRRLATLQDSSRLPSTDSKPVGRPSRLDSVWVSDASSGAERLVFRLDAPSKSMLGLVAQEELSSVTWLPDSRHLLIASRFGDAASGGPLRTRLLLVDAGDQGAERLADHPLELIVLPADVLLQSGVWSPDQQHVAVLVRVPRTSGTNALVGVGVLDVSKSAEARFQYLADLGSDDIPVRRLPVAPVAWDPSADEGNGQQRLAYTAPVPNSTPAGGGPLGLFGFGRASAATPGALFLGNVSSSMAAGDAPRLGTVSGIVGLVWRSTTPGTQGAPLLGVFRGAGNVDLRAIDAATGQVRELGVHLARDVAGTSNVLGVRWDVAHARALVLARPDRASAPDSDAVDAWLVDFSSGAREAH